MYYDKATLERDIAKINSRYGVRKHYGFYTITESKIGKLHIEYGGPIPMDEGVAYDGAYIHCNKLKMCDPAAKLILSLAVETDDYFSLLSSPANLLTNDRG
jgi:hypothetical protein|tara:strand:- start:117 stop:419 length:303 start_codon:yes stop_codon:yes gene_type:complete